MLEKVLENTKNSTNKKPLEAYCKNCNALLKPYLRPAIFGLAAKWLPPSELCGDCDQKEEQRKKIIEEQKRLDEAFCHSRISIRFKGRTFENFVPEFHTQKAYKIALNFQPTNTGLIFLGSCGVGKTHLAAAIANRQIGKMPTLFISCPELLLEIRNSFHNTRKDHFQLFDLARKVQLLVLDDIGAEKASEWVQETIFVLINYRYEQMLPTIFTSNCMLGELEEKLGKRIVSRIIEMCRCVNMVGVDWRVKHRKQLLETRYE